MLYRESISTSLAAYENLKTGHLTIQLRRLMQNIIGLLEGLSTDDHKWYKSESSRRLFSRAVSASSQFVSHPLAGSTLIRLPPESGNNCSGSKSSQWMGERQVDEFHLSRWRRCQVNKLSPSQISRTCNFPYGVTILNKLV